MVKQYIAYLKNNPRGYWFRRKWYGWGWVPARWQGWLSFLVYLILLVLTGNRIDNNSHSSSDALGASLPLIIATAILVALCVWKGEKPRWQWGNPDKDTTGK